MRKIDELISYYARRMQNAERNLQNAKTDEQKAYYDGCLDELRDFLDNLNYYKKVNR